MLVHCITGTQILYPRSDWSEGVTSVNLHTSDTQTSSDWSTAEKSHTSLAIIGRSTSSVLLELITGCYVIMWGVLWSISGLLWSLVKSFGVMWIIVEYCGPNIRDITRHIRVRWGMMRNVSCETWWSFRQESGDWTVKSPPPPTINYSFSSPSLQLM